MDITADVLVGQREGRYGIAGVGLQDRVASPGQMGLTLRNDAGSIGGSGRLLQSEPNRVAERVWGWVARFDRPLPT